MQLILKSAIILALLGVGFQAYELNALRYKNLKCEFNAEYISESVCKIFINKDRQAGLTGGVHIIKEMTSLKNKIQIYKWSNGYKPAFLKMTMDICHYLNGGGGVFSKLVRTVSQPFLPKKYSCPFSPAWYNTSVIMSDLRAVQSMVPYGAYLCSMTFYDGNLTTKYGIVEIFADVYENFKSSTGPH